MEHCPDFERAKRYFERKGFTSGTKRNLLPEEDMMMRSVLDGIGALLQVQHMKRTLGRSAKSKVFFAALAAIASITLDDMDTFGEQNIVANFMTCCFPGDVERLGRSTGADRDWMPRLWAGLLRDTKGVRNDELISDREDKDKYSMSKDSHIVKATAGHFAAAARQPSMSAIDKFILMGDKEAIVRHPDAQGRLLLHYAALYSESTSMIELLVSLYPDAVKVCDTALGRTPLHMLAERPCFDSQYSMIRCLVNADCGVLKMIDKTGNTPLHSSCHSAGKGREVIVNYLLELHKESVFEQNKCGRLPLHLACEVDDDSAAPVVARLLSLFPEGAKMADQDGMLPLHFASASSSIKVVRILLDAYPDAVKQNIDFYGTPLHQTACQTQNRKKIISILHDAYPEAASLAAKGTLWLPLHASADLGNYLSIFELYKLYPEAVSHKDAEGSLPLHILLANKDPVMYTFAPMSEEAAALRFLLSKYPAAVGVANIKEVLHQRHYQQYYYQSASCPHSRKGEYEVPRSNEATHV